MNTFQGFLENFYGTLFSPNETFERLKQNPPLFQAFITVILISALNPLIDFDLLFGIQSIILLGIKLFVAVFTGLLSWLFFASFIDILASIFKQSGRIKEFLTLSGFALIPWIFLAPIELFKLAGILGDIFGILLGLAVWLWVVVLILTAIVKTYNLSFGRVIILAVIPFLGGFLAFNWFIGFFTTLIQILKI